MEHPADDQLKMISLRKSESLSTFVCACVYEREGERERERETEREREREREDKKNSILIFEQKRNETNKNVFI